MALRGTGPHVNQSITCLDHPCIICLLGGACRLCVCIREKRRASDGRVKSDTSRLDEPILLLQGLMCFVLYVTC